ncbi:MAG: hypothetical protein ACE5HJ_02205 [Thermoplasmata archaeon]
MDFLEGPEDPSKARKKKVGKVLGVFGLLLLFGSALSTLFVPPGWETFTVALIASGAGIIMVSYFLVR